jgi:hypothetical protein
LRPVRFVILLFAVVLAASQTLTGSATVSTNVRVTHDNSTGGGYVSADQMAGGTYTDGVLSRCGTDRRQQNEPTLAIDPRNTAIRTSGSNDYCGIPTNGDAWAGFYRSADSGVSWTDSLLPGYLLDTSPQGTASPVHQMALGGAIAAGDPVQAWDNAGNLFFMGNNFNRGVEDGPSASFRDNTGDVWVATYAASNPNKSATDGSRYVRTVILASNTFGNGSFNDKTGIQVDQATGNVYAAWSDFHGRGCNEIVFSRSTDHGATFSAPMKISSVCNNQGPNIAIGPSGQVYVSWFANTGGTKSRGSNFSEGAAFVSSNDFGQTFSMATIAVPFTPFVSNQFSGNGARQCGDAPSNCPTGQTFPRFDLSQPTLTTNGNDIAMLFQVALANGQGQAQFTKSSNGGATWTTPAGIDPQAKGHQFFPWITAANGKYSAVYYDSRADINYSPTTAPCNDSNGNGYACLNVFYTSSTDGVTWTTSVKLTSVPTNPNFEQFGGRTVPFFGDYIMVAAVGNNVEAVWTDQRDTVAGPDSDGNDPLGDTHNGGTCGPVTTCFDLTGGLDQNTYTASVS